jgi:hypothetical protein
MNCSYLSAGRFVTGEKKEDEICTSSFSSSTIPLTSGIEEAPQLLLSVVLFYHTLVAVRKALSVQAVTSPPRAPGEATSFDDVTPFRVAY